MSRRVATGLAGAALAVLWAAGSARAAECYTQCAQVTRTGTASSCKVIVKNVCQQPLHIIVYCPPGISCSRTGILVQPGAAFTATSSPACEGIHKYSFGPANRGYGQDYHAACGSRGIGCTGSNCW